jgi:hypothetical protein
MRVLVLRHDFEPHEAAIPLSLTGLPPGNPRFAGLGAAIEHRFDRAASGRVEPYCADVAATARSEGGPWANREPLVNGLPWTAPAVAAAIEAAVGPGARLARYDGPDRFDVLPLRGHGWGHRRAGAGSLQAP